MHIPKLLEIIITYELHDRVEVLTAINFTASYYFLQPFMLFSIFTAIHLDGLRLQSQYLFLEPLVSNAVVSLLCSITKQASARCQMSKY